MLPQFIEGLCQTNCLHTRFRLLCAALQHLGFDGVLYTAIPSFMLDSRYLAITEGLSPIFLHSESYDMSFLQHYAEANLIRSDFTIQNVAAGMTTPMLWHQHRPQLAKAQQDVLSIAESYGIRHGITIPLHSSQQGVAGASLIFFGSRDQFEQLIHLHLATIKHMLQLFHAYTHTMTMHPHFVRPLLPSLDALETKILRALSLGASPADAAHQFKRSEAYIKRKLSDVYAKYKLYDEQGSLVNISRQELIFLLGRYDFLR